MTRAGLIAPGGMVTRAMLKRAAAQIEGWGMTPFFGESCQGGADTLYLAAADEARARDINLFFRRRDISAIFCIRGGYGAQRTLPLLDYEAIAGNPKPFAGFSDATALHAVLNQKCGMVTYHAPMLGVSVFSDLHEKARDSFARNLLTNEGAYLSVKAKADNCGAALVPMRPGAAEGRLCGGNLSLLASGIGTEYELDTSGKILFIEEANEPLYKIDRLLLQLHLAGKLEAAAGIIFGFLAEKDGAEEYFTNEFTFIERIKADIPIARGLFAGHTGARNLTLPLYRRVRLSVLRENVELELTRE